MTMPTPEGMDRLKSLVSALAQQTANGRLKWRNRSPSGLGRAFDREVFTVSLPKSTVTVDSRPSISVSDEKGETIQEYAPTLDGPADPKMAKLLRGLLSEIHEEQRRGLAALDNIIRDVERLGDGSNKSPENRENRGPSFF